MIELECENRHRFKTNLPIGQAQCPDCNTKNCKVYQEPPVREEPAT